MQVIGLKGETADAIESMFAADETSQEGYF
jgi:hypothetical protein